MNPYLKNLKKLEFVVTDACTGKCRHCSEGDHAACGTHLEPNLAADAVARVAAVYRLETVMAFGGEPLLYPETVEAIMRAALAAGVAHRQVITNGYFSRDPGAMRVMAARLAACGVSDLLLSVDAFHEEFIPIATVRRFAEEAQAAGIPIRLQPAWLVSLEDDNPYNRETRRLLDSFCDTGIPIGGGNVVFPEGNARIHLAEYFHGDAPKNPYVEDPRDVRCLSFSPNGEVLDGNIRHTDILKILENYAPRKEEA